MKRMYFSLKKTTPPEKVMSVLPPKILIFLQKQMSFRKIRLFNFDPFVRMKSDGHIFIKPKSHIAAADSHTPSDSFHEIHAEIFCAPAHGIEGITRPRILLNNIILHTGFFG